MIRALCLFYSTGNIRDGQLELKRLFDLATTLFLSSLSLAFSPFLSHFLPLCRLLRLGQFRVNLDSHLDPCSVSLVQYPDYNGQNRTAS